MSPVATIQRAIAALLAAQHADGSFRDFALGIGSSGPWVTAHVGARLASLPPRYRDERVASAIAGAAHYLGEHRWSYNEHAPADADSIAHALIFLGALGERRPDAARALTAYQLPDGGFATFLPGTYTSWTHAHPDVTPVAVRALAAYGDDDAIARALPHRHGVRAAFWWDLDWYTTAMWVDACAALAVPFDPAPQPTAHPRTLLDAAYRFAIACAAGWHMLVDELADLLLAAATPTGLWPPSRVLRVTVPDEPQPWMLAGEAGGLLYADVHGVYSTAVITSVLAAWWR